MTTFPIHLDWSRDSKGYRLVDYGKYGMFIEQNGGREILFQPLANNDMVFTAFSKVTSPESLLRFVDLYGFLESATHPYGAAFFASEAGGFRPIEGAPSPKGEKVASHLQTAKLFRDVLKCTSKGWSQMPKRLAEALSYKLNNRVLGEVRLVADSGRGVRMALNTTSLLDGLWLQLVQKISGQSAFQACALPRCGELFEVGSSFGRRADARFCSDAHRIEFNSLKRSKGMARH